MHYGVWATFADKGSPLFFNTKCDSVEEAMELGVEMFDGAERILVSVPC